jgi:RNase P subunit RPR2
MEHGLCPKCHADALYSSASAPIGRLNRIQRAGIVTYVVCAACGYTEGYLLNPFERDTVRAEWAVVKEVNLETFNKRPMLPTSMQENTCPVCGEHNIRQSLHTDALMIAQGLVASLTHYVCLDCGSIERYVLSQGDRHAIERHWARAARPPARSS